MKEFARYFEAVLSVLLPLAAWMAVFSLCTLRLDASFTLKALLPLALVVCTGLGFLLCARSQ